MQFERIKKNHKRKIIIGGLILVCVISAITITTTRAKYKLTEDIPLVRGTINYKVPDLRLVAVSISEDGTNYNIVDEIPTSGYKLNTTKSICKIATTDTKDEEVTIEYKEGKVNILGVTKKGTKCYLYFDKKKPTGSEIILGNITVKEGTPDFSNAATTDEGVYKVSDGMYGGYSYYWRGAVTSNYVRFGNFCWRAIRINGDGSIRLIYDGATCHANGTSTIESIALENIKYNSSYNQPNYVGWTYIGTSQRTLSGTPSNAKTQLESWYVSNIGNNTAYSTKVADGKYCNDRNVQSGYTWAIDGSSFYYAGNKRLYTDYAPALSCNSGDVYTLKVGLITADEVEFAGGKNVDNKSYYLYNGHNYWTMSPNRWYGPYTLVFFADVNGQLNNTNVDFPYGLRPVINLKSDVTFTGNGTIDNPYVVI